GGGGVEEQRVLAVPERGVEVAGPAREPVRLRQLRQLCLVAADENRIGHHPVAVLERDAALRADGENRADQMLVHAHAAGDAVHDDAEPVLRHLMWDPLFDSGQTYSVMAAALRFVIAGLDPAIHPLRKGLFGQRRWMRGS